MTSDAGRTPSSEREWDGWVWRPLAGNECMTGSDTYPPEWKGEAGPGWRRVRPVAGRTLSRWEGFVEVCNTCDRKAQWPFCEHKTDDGKWYRLVVVREVGRGR